MNECCHARLRAHVGIGLRHPRKMPPSVPRTMARAMVLPMEPPIDLPMLPAIPPTTRLVTERVTSRVTRWVVDEPVAAGPVGAEQTTEHIGDPAEHASTRRGRALRCAAGRVRILGALLQHLKGGFPVDGRHRICP